MEPEDGWRRGLRSAGERLELAVKAQDGGEGWRSPRGGGRRRQKLNKAEGP
jgi:hypothetical protein